MKSFLFLFILVCSIVNASAQFQGTWNGALDINGFKLPIVFHVADDNGSCISTFDSPLQEAFGVPVKKTKCTEDSIYFYMNDIDAVFAGEYIAKEEKFEGVFTQRGAEMDLILSKGDYAEVKPNRPQEPKEPYPYIVKQVRFENKKDGVTLAGTLTLPDTLKKYPVVVLISGSGPQDRDETLLGHKPFWIIADYLTRNGFAVLRYDDRGVGESTGKFAESTSLDFSYDAESALSFLQKLPYINPKQMGFAGHSEGGMIAPMIAARNKNVAFLILLAGPGVNGEEIIIRQTELIGTAEGEGDAKKSAETNRKLIKALLSSRTPEKSAAAMRKVFHEEFKLLSAEELKEYQDTAMYINQNISQMNNHWFRYFLTYDPAASLQKVKCPVLVLNGDKDLQVDSRQNMPPIEAALKKAKNKNYKMVELSNLNHLFQHTTTGKVSEYGNIEETFAPIALKEMSDWLKSVLK